MVAAARRLCDGPLEHALTDVAARHLLHELSGRRVPLQELTSRVLVPLTRNHVLDATLAEVLRFALRTCPGNREQVRAYDCERWRSRSDTYRRTQPLDIQPVGGGDAAVPVSRVLDRALLASEVRIDQAVSLCVPLRPLEVV